MTSTRSSTRLSCRIVGIGITLGCLFRPSSGGCRALLSLAGPGNLWGVRMHVWCMWSGGCC